MSTLAANTVLRLREGQTVRYNTSDTPPGAQAAEHLSEAAHPSINHPLPIHPIPPSPHAATVQPIAWARCPVCPVPSRDGQSGANSETARRHSTKQQPGEWVGTGGGGSPSLPSLP
jgi:hypothetical protein